MKCNDCPRKCNAERDKISGDGFCGTGFYPHVSKIMLHKWEEPCISGENGAGNIFFSGCNLKCRYCQNNKITLSYSAGENIPVCTPENIRHLISDIDSGEAHNINFVTPDCYLRTLSEAITPEFKEKIHKPIIINCSGYNSVEMLELLKNKVDIFLPDFKYARPSVAKKYSNAENYPEIAEKAIRKMFELTGPCTFEENGLLKSGVIIRHLILPSNLPNTLDVIDKVNEMFKPGEIIFSLMSQYTPCADNSFIADFPELHRKITAYEKRKSETYLFNTDISLAYVQEDGSAEQCYIPDFE